MTARKFSEIKWTERTREYQFVEGVYQQAPYTGEWYAGYGAQYKVGNRLVSGGCYLAELCATKQDAKRAAVELAQSHRNSLLTMGEFTFETLPPIKLRQVGQ